MAELNLSSELFAGALIFLAIEAAGTSDAVTKPVAGSGLWLEVASVEKWQPKPIQYSEDADEPDPDTGWRTGKRVYTTGFLYEVVTRKTSALYHQLSMGLATAPVAGTAQTPHVKADNKVRAWIKVQLRQHIGTDRFVLDEWCEVRAMGDLPAAEKATQKPNLEFYCLKSALNAFNIPT